MIGFNSNNGRPNLRLEVTDGARPAPQEFGGVAQNQGDAMTDPYWTFIDDEGGKKA